MQKVWLVGIFLFVGLISSSFAQELVESKESIEKARITNLFMQEVRPSGLSEKQVTLYHYEAELLSGTNKGETVELRDVLLDAQVGTVVYVRHIQERDGSEYFVLTEPARGGKLLALSLVLVALVIIVGKRQGVLAIVSLCLTVLLVIYVLIPGLLKGYSPVLVAFSIATCALALVMYMTHGFRRMTSAAFVGSSVALLVTLLTSLYAVHLLAFTGLASDEAAYLQLTGASLINLRDLLIASMLIGIVGAVNDVAITQSAITMELLATKGLSRASVFSKAMAVGRDHTGSLINTLVLAYVGASLPLMLLLSQSELALSYVLSMEVVAVEVVRSIIGSIGVVLVVPLSTLLAMYFYKEGTHGGPGHDHHHSHNH